MTSLELSLHLRDAREVGRQRELLRSHPQLSWLEATLIATSVVPLERALRDLRAAGRLPDDEPPDQAA